ncbi:alpha/beta fold hydrolase [Goodfellowiella coeruleoviolacea]|uniref:Pimeloyl-ACP methyl ester carboxylesterase n=1 Tax=Goodfellowiella coeruleoviolacea TaxID=334858 RepID=A0AAE3GJX1_9PSEU|nr:alpha/beta hydrolase [Goodfellowiella coeruleoviolacea]MCP2168810.1 Pimeloyl-ACP methyl ester carboxylesterase [Goodfellowiella coeruleoviolacea]
MTDAHSTHATGGGQARPARVPLTFVPLSTAPLELDTSIPPWPGRQVPLAGATLHVRETPGPHPDAPTAVYVHGLGGSATNWTDLANLLAGSAHGVAVDLPGFGQSEPPAGFDFALTSHAAVVADYLAGLDRGPVHLLGNSMGGAIAMLVAAERPELVRTLTLVSPAVPDLRPDLRRMADPRMPLAYLPVLGGPVRRQLASLTPRQRAEQMIRLCFADPGRVPEHRVAESAQEIAGRLGLPWAADAINRSTLGLIRAWLVPRARSLWQVAPRVSVPALVVWGDRDRLVSVRKAARTAELLPRGRLLVLPGTGHCAQMEQPVSVARAVLGMWGAVAERAW